MNRMSVTQKEIAAKLNISQSQVARALSGNSVVAEKTRLRIEAAAREMGYDPDAHSEARFMNARRHNKPIKKGTIAMLFHFMGAPLRVIPFYTPFLEGIEEETAVIGSNLCLCLIRIAELPRLIRDRNVDGVIVLGDFPQLSAEMKSIGLPVLSFHSQFEGICNVRPDDFNGARLATQHLYDLGHRRIGFVGIVNQVHHSEGDPSMARYRGYAEAMRENGLDVRDEWVTIDFGMPQSSADTYCTDVGHCQRCAACLGWEHLVEKNRANGTSAEFPTAFVCHNDNIAMGIATNAASDGVLVPRDLSLVGFDDMSLQYHFSPALTSVALPLYEMGKRAVQLLNQMGQETGSEEQLDNILPVNLVVRESTQALDVTVPALS
jgi:LacI family transcriptional regulator